MQMTIITLSTVLLLVGVIIVWRLTRTHLTCPECGSQHISPLSKQMLNFQTIEYGGYQQTSGLQPRRYKMAYYCSHCKTRWTKTSAFA